MPLDLTVPADAPPIESILNTNLRGFINTSPMAPEVRGQILRTTGFYISPALHAQLATPERIMAWVRIQWHAKHIVKAPTPTPAPIPPENGDDETLRVYVEFTRRVRCLERWDRMQGYVEVPIDVAEQGVDSVTEWVSNRVRDYHDEVAHLEVHELGEVYEEDSEQSIDEWHNYSDIDEFLIQHFDN